jgi:hypothetical protein
MFIKLLNPGNGIRRTWTLGAFLLVSLPFVGSELQEIITD